MAVFQVLLKTLTPLHVGDGDELRQDFDFSVQGGRTYRLNEDVILQANEARLKPNARGEYPLPAHLLNEADYRDGQFFRYTIPGVPRSKKTDARVKSYIKDVFDRPYIPGSSLKGALRTALAWNAWGEVKPHLDRGAVGRSRSWAAQPLERKLFGPDPNHDLLRALHVADLHGTQKPGEGLMLVNAQVLTKKSAGSPVELEAIKSEMTFRGSLTVDETLFGAWAEPQLHFADRKHWLMELMARAQKHSLARIERLADWYEHAEGCEGIARFYRDLAQANLPARSAVLQIGWGAGWDGKTLWTHLQQDPLLFEQLVIDFRLHKAGRDSPPRKAGDPFPRSKRAAMNKDNKPTAPMGWVLVQLKPVGELPTEWAGQPYEVERPLQPTPKAEAAPTSVVTPSTPAKPEKPAAPPMPETPHTPPPQRMAPRPIIREFTELPKVGARFRAVVMDSEANGKLTLELPGLSPDDVAIGEVLPENNPERKKFRPGAEVTCEVLSVTPDPHQKGLMLVQCARE